MAPFAAGIVRPVVGPPADRDARAGARAQDHREDDVEPRPGAVHRFGGGEAVGVVFHAQRAGQARVQVRFDRACPEARSNLRPCPAG